MKTNSFKCPYCGASIVASDEKNETQCSYCRSTVVLEDIYNKVNQTDLKEDVELGLELIGAGRYSDADDHFANCCKKYRTSPIFFFWKGMTTILCGRESDEADYYLNKYPIDDKCISPYLTQAKEQIGNHLLKCFHSFDWKQFFRLMPSWESGAVLLESLLSVYPESPRVKWDVAGYYMDIVLESARPEINPSIQDCNQMVLFLDHAIDLLATVPDDDKEVYKKDMDLPSSIGYAFLNLATSFYNNKLAIDAKIMVERGIGFDSKNIKDYWIDLLRSAIKGGFENDVISYNQKVFQLNLFPEDWSKLIKTAVENGCYNVAICYIRHVAADYFDSYRSPGVKQIRWRSYYGGQLIDWFIISSRKNVPEVDIDLVNQFYNTFSKENFAAQLFGSIFLELARYAGKNLNFDLANSYLNQAKFGKNKPINPRQLIGPQLIYYQDDSLFSPQNRYMVKEMVSTEDGYGYLGLAELAKQNSQRDLVKKYLKEVEQLLNYVKIEAPTSYIDFVTKTRKQLEILINK